MLQLRGISWKFVEWYVAHVPFVVWCIGTTLAPSVFLSTQTSAAPRLAVWPFFLSLLSKIFWTTAAWSFCAFSIADWQNTPGPPRSTSRRLPNVSTTGVGSPRVSPPVRIAHGKEGGRRTVELPAQRHTVEPDKAVKCDKSSAVTALRQALNESHEASTGSGAINSSPPHAISSNQIAPVKGSPRTVHHTTSGGLRQSANQNIPMWRRIPRQSANPGGSCGETLDR